MKKLSKISVITEKGMALIKGGNTTQALAALSTSNASSVAVTTVTSIAADDKRPARPGGGISTL